MYSRETPYLATLEKKQVLTHPNSTRKTYHVTLKIDPEAFPFEVGDSVAILPQNCPSQVKELLNQLQIPKHTHLHLEKKNTSFPLEEYLLKHAQFSQLTPTFAKKALQEIDPNSPLLLEEHKQALKEHLGTRDLFDLLQGKKIPPALLSHLKPLLPRFYSIANSAKYSPGKLELTVAHVEFTLHGRVRQGIGSHYLCHLLNPQDKVPIYLQKSNHFTLPQDPSAPIILIGPGTGIAPYRAFLQERLTQDAPGKSWLFFGERNRAYDFYYEDFLQDLVHQKKLKLTLAFSRDQQEKIYVQHKLYENRQELLRWIEEGAILYICGDATYMAKSVHSTLSQIFQEEKNLSPQEAEVLLKKLRKENRYRLDVY